MRHHFYYQISKILKGGKNLELLRAQENIAGKSVDYNKILKNNLTLLKINIPYESNHLKVLRKYSIK